MVVKKQYEDLEVLKFVYDPTQILEQSLRINLKVIPSNLYLSQNTKT